LENQEIIAGILYSRGEIALAQSDSAEAVRQFEQVLTLGREKQDKPIIALALYGLGKVAQAKGDFASAHAFQAEALTNHRDTGDRREIAHALVSLAAFAAAEQQAIHAPLCLEDLQRAARLFGAAEKESLPRLTQRIWVSLEPADPEHLVSDVRAQLGEAAFAAAWAAGQALTLEEAVAEALAEDAEEA
jgi:tetratricopeptide (TPR) repeat protein